MKQKINTLLCGCLALLTSITINAQTELKGWHLAPKLIDMQGSTPVVRPTAFTTNFATAGQNSIYDSEGKLLFYIAAGGVYNKFNQSIGALSPTYLALSEICIVPHPLNSACFNKYYLVYPEYQSTKQYGNLRYDLIDMNGNSGRGQYLAGASLAINFSNTTGIPLAVSKLVGGKRFVYCVGGSLNQLLMFEISSSGVSTTINQLTPALGASLNGYELELSNAGDKIAFLSGVSSFDEMTVMNLNPLTGLQTGTPFTFTSKNFIYGLEFNTLGDKLYYSNGSGIWVKQLTTPFNTIPITTSATFSKSMLEKNYNGNLILCASTSQLNWIDATTDLLGSSPISCSLAYNPTNNFVLMPDQIDGENYDASGTTNVDVDIFNVSANAIWDVTANPFLAVQLNSYLGSLIVLPKVRVARQINIPSGFSIIVNQLPFEFHTNAEWNVNGGANLRLMGTLLQGHSCGLMWRGISVNNNNTTNANNFKMTNNGAVNSTIYDAYKGVEANGNNATVIIENNSLFDKNEKGVVLNSVNPSLISITGSYFYSTLPLKDQTKGQVLSTSGTVRYGITGIEANTSGTSTNKLKIGSATIGNSFKSGQHGVRSLRTDILIQKNNFQDADNAAVSGDANFMGARETDVFDNTFLNNNVDTWISFGCNEKAYRNTLTNTKKYSIFWTYNGGNRLDVGNDLIPADANTFQGYAWAPIAVSNCESPSTQIEIHRNLFQNAPWAGGVYISENTLTSASKTYNGYRVKNNNFTNVGGAVKIINIKGDNLTTNTNWNGDLVASANYDIQNNTVSLATTHDVSARAIRVENSWKNRALSNIITSDNSANWQNEAISFLNSPSSLIKSNVLQAGIGIGLGLDMMESNVLCNTLKYCVKGIGPGWSWMRNTGTQHGESGIRGRQNTFISNTYDIEMYYSYTSNYQWICPNTTNINYNPGGPYGTNIIYSTSELSPCPTNTSSGKMTSDTDNSSITSDVNDIPTNYSNDVAVAQNKSKQFTDGLQSIKINNAAMLTTNNMTALAKAQLLYEAKNYTGCAANLQQMANADVIESNLATVLGILNTLRLENRYEYKSSEKADLIAIAQSDSRLGGQGVHYARGILLINYNLQFEDPYLYAPADKAKTRMIKQIDSEQNAQLIGLYPNPAKTQVTLATTNGNKTIIIYNNMGSKVYNTTTTGLLTIDVINWNSGMYLVEIYDATTNKKEISKFIIE